MELCHPADVQDFVRSSRVGSTYRQVRTLPKPMEEELEIQVYEPAHRLVVGGGFASFQGVSSYVLDALGDATKLTNEIELHASGALGTFAALTTSGIKRAVAQNLTVLKGLLETPEQ